MKAENPTTKAKFISLPVRHSPDVIKQIETLAGTENLSNSAMCRVLINAGLKTLYGITLNNNQIVN